MESLFFLSAPSVSARNASNQMQRTNVVRQASLPQRDLFRFPKGRRE
jgi:hypothetical protein